MSVLGVGQECGGVVMAEAELGELGIRPELGPGESQLMPGGRPGASGRRVVPEEALERRVHQRSLDGVR